MRWEDSPVCADEGGEGSVQLPFQNHACSVASVMSTSLQPYAL